MIFPNSWQEILIPLYDRVAQSRANYKIGCWSSDSIRCNSRGTEYDLSNWVDTTHRNPTLWEESVRAQNLKYGIVN